MSSATDDSAGGMQVEQLRRGHHVDVPRAVRVRNPRQKDRDADPPKKRSTVKQKVFVGGAVAYQTTTQSTAMTVAEPGP